MSLHIFANIVTSYGTAANNRAETEGNITTLQKLIWQGQPHGTVSSPWWNGLIEVTHSTRKDPNWPDHPESHDIV